LEREVFHGRSREARDSQIPIFNFQIPNKLQFSKSKILKFFYLELEIYLEFDIWCLEFAKPCASHELPPTLNNPKIQPNAKLQ